MRWAAGSSKPDEIHCWSFHRCCLRTRRFQIPTPLDNFAGGGKNSDKPERIYSFERQLRQRRIRQIGRFGRAAALTTWPRLTVSPFTRLVMEYQLMSANVTPRSLSAIQVPPPGSEGESTVHPLMIFLAGGRPADARQLFVAVHPERVTMFARNKSDRAHGSIGGGISRGEGGIIAPLPPAMHKLSSARSRAGDFPRRWRRPNPIAGTACDRRDHKEFRAS